MHSRNFIIIEREKKESPPKKYPRRKINSNKKKNRVRNLARRHCVSRELHTVSQQSPCCHSVVFEALGERNRLHLCFKLKKKKIPLSIYVLDTSPWKRCRARQHNGFFIARRPGLFQIPNGSWFYGVGEEKKKAELGWIRNPVRCCWLG